MKYNYVILGSEADFYMASYADLFNCSYHTNYYSLSIANAQCH